MFLASMVLELTLDAKVGEMRPGPRKNSPMIETNKSDAIRLPVGDLLMIYVARQSLYLTKK